MKLTDAIKTRDEARAKMDSLKVGSKKWVEAEEDLNFWQSKVAMIEAMP